MRTKDQSKNLKKELRETFPDVKFSVRTRLYSGGSSIDVYFDGDIDYERVKSIANKYENYRRDEITGDILSGGNTFVFVYAGHRRLI